MLTVPVMTIKDENMQKLCFKYNIYLLKYSFQVGMR